MKIKHLVISIGIISAILFVGCSGRDSTSSTTSAPVKEGNTLYENNNFSIEIPKPWETIDKGSFTSNVPLETIVGFRNNIRSDIFTANLNISQKSLDPKQVITSKDFAKSSLEIARNNLIGYQLLSEKEGKMAYGKDGLATYLAEYEGKKSASEQIIHFTELYVVNNNFGYTVIGSYLPNEDESVVKTVEDMLSSFLLK